MILCSCVPLTVQKTVSADYCGQSTVNAVTRNSPLSGDVALTSRAAVVFTPSRVTAISSMTDNNQTVLFAGTADGRIVKVSVSPKFNCSSLQFALCKPLWPDYRYTNSRFDHTCVHVYGLHRCRSSWFRFIFWKITTIRKLSFAVFVVFQLNTSHTQLFEIFD